ncbi:MAG: Nif3-like dinuclear metal center hexameric protein [Flavobacteriales bacterium]|nr:MAG: Nif3-like dinuclear metal center hexameric protein [Flavobacteriales bacterium]
MTIKDITNYLETIAPLHYSEDFDNTGLLVGEYTTVVTGILVTLDTLEAVVDEAIEQNCNLIVSFHPIIFSGLKKLNGKNYVEKAILKAIQNNIAIYSMHTALDNSSKGVAAAMADKLGLQNRSVLLPKSGLIKKLTTYVPNKKADTVRRALFKAGAGAIGNYNHCSYNLKGLGTFLGNEAANPTVGKRGVLQQESETYISVVFEKHLENKILKALFDSHPYEEVAYDLVTTDNIHQNIGMGIIGELTNAAEELEFMANLKEKFNLKSIRHSKLLGKKIKKVAVLGGSGSFAIDAAKHLGADIYISADFKYHDFFKAEGTIVLADIGHFESEQFTKNLLTDYLTKKFRNFAVVLSKTTTNPIHYYI